MTISTGIDEIDALAYRSWNTTPGKGEVLRFSFLSTPPADADSDDLNGFAPMSPLLRNATRAALATWAAVADLTFIEVASGGDIQFGTNDQRNDETAGYAYFPDAGSRTASQVYLNKFSATLNDIAPGQYGFTVLMHEIGHALGLKHPGNYNGSDGTGHAPFLSEELDTNDYTVMSYHDASSFAYTHMDPGTPMLLDIAAIQYLYGPNLLAHTGDDTYKFTDRSVPQTIWDAGGYNIFDFSGCSGAVMIDLRDGEYSATRENYDNIWIALGVKIHMALGGAGDDQIYCGFDGSVVQSGDGADLIFSGNGDDVVYAGNGNDTARYFGNADQYLVTNQGGNWVVHGEGKDIWYGVENFRFEDKESSIANMARLSAPLADQQTLAGKALLLTLPAQSFTTAAGAPTLNATLASGRPLPSWLSFDAATGRFTGTPGAGDVGSITVRVTAANAGQVAVGDDFVLSISSSALSGSAGNDVLSAGAGSEAINGGAGRDMLKYAGPRANYTITALGDGFSVKDNVGSGATDHLLNVERLQFGDNTEIALDNNGGGGQTYRLYQAAFDRAPDLVGLGFWVKANDNGVTLRTVAAQFLTSAEFVTKYGTMTDTEFVTLMYANVLHRQPDLPGLAYHLNNLTTHVTERVDTLLEFSESYENQAALIGVVENGFAYEPWLK